MCIEASDERPSQKGVGGFHWVTSILPMQDEHLSVILQISQMFDWREIARIHPPIKGQDISSTLAL